MTKDTDDFLKGAKPFKAPEMTLNRRVEMTRAADAYHEANRSDPFARSRVMTYMRRGIELPSDVLKEARRGKTDEPPVT
jgi:hypothetical protein